MILTVAENKSPEPREWTGVLWLAVCVAGADGRCRWTRPTRTTGIPRTSCMLQIQNCQTLFKCLQWSTVQTDISWSCFCEFRGVQGFRGYKERRLVCHVTVCKSDQSALTSKRNFPTNILTSEPQKSHFDLIRTRKNFIYISSPLRLTFVWSWWCRVFVSGSGGPQSSDTRSTRTEGELTVLI